MENTTVQGHIRSGWEKDWKLWGLIAAPIILTLSMVAAFQGLVASLGDPLGYLAAFIVYWLGWCLIFPAVILGGPRKILRLFIEGKPESTSLGWKMHLLLWGPVLFPILFMFVPKVSQANFPILFVSILLGLVIGVTEEILWRGIYVRLFPRNIWMNTIYPSIMFGIWHLAPQSVRTNSLPGGAASFVLYAVLLGLIYAWTARKSGSIRWCTAAHIIHDVFGLGAFVYAAWLI